ncbi:MAG: hypothetical protein OHK0021_24450 [Bryobacter sp.]
MSTIMPNQDLGLKGFLHEFGPLRTLASCVLLLAVALLAIYAVRLGGWSRPTEVSKEAVWVVGPKSAHWFDCRVAEERDANFCRVWTEGGQLLVEGFFVLEVEGRAAKREELRPSSIGESDGLGGLNSIHLFDEQGRIMGRTLILPSQRRIATVD